MGLVFTNLDEWTNELGAQFEAVTREAEKSIDALGEDIAQRERAGLPRGDAAPHAADTVEITSGRTDGEYYIDVGPSKAGFYLAYYEFGTGHQPARPVMRPIIAAAVSAWT